MSGLEVVGSVASVLQLAATVYSISKTLYEVGDALSNAPSDIKELARDLDTFAEELHLLSSLLSDKTHRYSDRVYRLTAKIIGDCASICFKIDRILKKLRSGSFLARVKWVFKEKEIMKLLARLRDLKLSLMSTLSLLSALKADHMMDALGLGNASLLEGPKDEQISKHTIEELEETRRKLAGIAASQTPATLSVTSSESTLVPSISQCSENSQLSMDSFQEVKPLDTLESFSSSATPLSSDIRSHLSVETRSIEQSDPSMFVSTTLLPQPNALMQLSQAMVSVESFYSAFSKHDNEDLDATHTKGKSATSFDSTKSGTTSGHSEILAQSTAEEWKAHVMQSAMTRFGLTQADATSWVAALPVPSFSDFGDLSKMSRDKINFRNGISPLAVRHLPSFEEDVSSPSSPVGNPADFHRAMGFAGPVLPDTNTVSVPQTRSGAAQEKDFDEHYGHKDLDQSENNGPVNGSFFSLDTNLSNMEDILAKLPPRTSLDDRMFAGNVGDEARAEAESTGSLRWKAPESWAVKEESQTQPTAFSQDLYMANALPLPDCPPLNPMKANLITSPSPPVAAQSYRITPIKFDVVQYGARRAPLGSVRDGRSVTSRQTTPAMEHDTIRQPEHEHERIFTRTMDYERGPCAVASREIGVLTTGTPEMNVQNGHSDHEMPDSLPFVTRSREKVSREKSRSWLARTGKRIRSPAKSWTGRWNPTSDQAEEDEVMDPAISSLEDQEEQESPDSFRNSAFGTFECERDKISSSGTDEDEEKRYEDECNEDIDYDKDVRGNNDDSEEKMGPSLQPATVRASSNKIKQLIPIPSFLPEYRQNDLWLVAFAKLCAHDAESCQGLSRAWVANCENVSFFAGSEHLVAGVTATRLLSVAEKTRTRMLESPKRARDSINLLIDRFSAILKIMQETLNFKTGGFVWTCLCFAEQEMLEKISASQKLNNTTDLENLSEVAILVARYNVLESMYKEWPGMSLERNYEASLIRLCVNVLKYLDLILSCTFEPGQNELEHERITLIADIRSADTVCRGFSVTIFGGDESEGIESRLGDGSADEHDSDSTETGDDGRTNLIRPTNANCFLGECGETQPC